LRHQDHRLTRGVRRPASRSHQLAQPRVGGGRGDERARTRWRPPRWLVRRMRRSCRPGVVPENR